MRFRQSISERSKQSIKLPKTKFGFGNRNPSRARASASMNLLSDIELSELNSGMSERRQQDTGSINTGPLSQRTFSGFANRSSTRLNPYKVFSDLEIEEAKRKKINTDKAKRNRSSSARSTALSQNRRKSY